MLLFNSSHLRWQSFEDFSVPTAGFSDGLCSCPFPRAWLLNLAFSPSVLHIPPPSPAPFSTSSSSS